MISCTLKYLIAGLGNIGETYKNTRHNIGFNVLDALAVEFKTDFRDRRYAFISEFRFKGRIFYLIKPSTYVNLSGKAVNYWLKKNKIPIENLLVVLDDLSLPFGTLRLKPSGSDGGHNGLIHISETLGTQNYARLRFGIGSDFPKGYQVEYVLGKWDDSEKELLPERILKANEMIKAFGTMGIDLTMSRYNNK